MVARRLPLALVLLAAAACGGSDGTEPPSPASIVAISPNPVAGAQVATAVAATPTFEVRSSAGEALAGVPVTVTVTQGGGSVAGAPTASLAGPTPIGQWTLGTLAGAQAVTVSVPGSAVPPLVFLTTAAPGAAASLLMLQGDNQVVPASTVVPSPIRVRVRDVHGNSVAGASVAWTVDAGGGNLASGESVSDAQGVATAPTWTVGPSGEQAILATLGTSEVRFVAVQTAFDIDIRYVGGAPSATVQQAFNNARERIRRMIIGDIPNVTVNNQDVSCIAAGPITETIDDVVIYARIQFIDGEGMILGQAGPCASRFPPSSLPATGVMSFDSADMDRLANEGRLENVILHEMLHVIGVGTIWDDKGLIADPLTASSRFTGAAARLACINDHGGAVPCNVAVPAENCLDLDPGQNCGPGTRDSHWKESIFDSELMTGYLGGGLQPLSAMTIRSLADLGYVVNAAAADAYSIPTPPGLWALFDEGRPKERMPAPLRPRYQIDGLGRAARIR